MRMQDFRLALAAAVLGGMLLAAGGCIVVAAGIAAAGTYVYTEGELKGTLDAPLARTHDAAKAAVADLGFTERLARVDAFEGRVEAETADRTTVTIRMKKLSDKTTEVRIRHGTLGDEGRSTAIFDAIKKKL